MKWKYIAIKDIKILLKDPSASCIITTTINVHDYYELCVEK